MTTHATRSCRPSRPLAPRAWAWLAIAYFTAQALGRIWVSPAPELDEAEQLLWTRELAWGYGTQPPLYTWLQAGVFALTGPSIAGLALLKNLLLLSLYLAVAWAGWPLIGAAAAPAAAAMLWLPQIGWESQRDLTHSVLATTACAVLLGAWVRLVREGRVFHHLVCGAAAAAALLGKYNAALWVLLLLAVAVGVPALRARLRVPALLAAAALAVLLLAPHLAWLAQHLPAASQGTLQKMAPGADGPWAARAQGLISLLTGLLSAGLLWALVFGVQIGGPVWRAGRRTPGRDGLATPASASVTTASTATTTATAGLPSGARAADPAVRRLVRLMAALLLAGLLALVLVGGLSHLRNRWLQPLLFALPLAGWLLLPRLPSAEVWCRHERTTLALAALLLFGQIARAPLAGWLGQPGQLNEPVAALAQAVQAVAPDVQTLVVHPPRLAAGLRGQFPRAHVLTADEWPAYASRGLPAGRTLWVATAGDPARHDRHDLHRGRLDPPPAVHAQWHWRLAPTWTRDPALQRDYRAWIPADQAPAWRGKRQGWARSAASSLRKAAGEVPTMRLNTFENAKAS
ncbi:MAG: hypothetical protein RL223_849 [Pseudomonadota bacterium]